MQIWPAIRERLFRNRARRQFRILNQGPSRRQGETATAADGCDSFVGFDYIAGSADQEGLFQIGNHQQGFQVAQHLVGTPILGQFHCGTSQVAGVLFQLGLEAAEQRERVRRGAGKASQNFVLIEPANFARGMLDHAVAQGHLAVGSHHDTFPATHAEHRGRANAPWAGI